MNTLELKQKGTKDLLEIAKEHGIKNISRQKKQILFLIFLNLFQLKTKIFQEEGFLKLYQMDLVF